MVDTGVMDMAHGGMVAAVGGNHLLPCTYKDPRFQAGIFFGTIE